MKAINNISFKGVYINNNAGSAQTEGFSLQELQKKYEGYSWKLNILPDKYTLRSPSTSKTYEGPFSVKKHVARNSAKEERHQLIIRMGERLAFTYRRFSII